MRPRTYVTEGVCGEWVLERGQMGRLKRKRMSCVLVLVNLQERKLTGIENWLSEAGVAEADEEEDGEQRTRTADEATTVKTMDGRRG